MALKVCRELLEQLIPTFLNKLCYYYLLSFVGYFKMHDFHGSMENRTIQCFICLFCSMITNELYQRTFLLCFWVDKAGYNNKCKIFMGLVRARAMMAQFEKRSLLTATMHQSKVLPSMVTRSTDKFSARYRCVFLALLCIPHK